MTRKTGAVKQLDAEAEKFYRRGWTDPMIAEKFGCSKSLVHRWRKSRVWPANAPTGSETWRLFRAQLKSQSETLKLHEDGLTDAAAARVLGITTKAFWARRTRLGLPKNRRRPQPGAR